MSNTVIAPAAGPNTDFGTPVVGPVHSQQHCEQTIQQYADTWSAIPTQHRQHLMHAALHPSITYSDKLSQARGYEQLAGNIEQFQVRFAGARFVTNKIMLHHQYGRLDYTMVDGQGAHVMDGTDFIEFADDGRLCKIVGFF